MRTLTPWLGPLRRVPRRSYHCTSRTSASLAMPSTPVVEASLRYTVRRLSPSVAVRGVRLLRSALLQVAVPEFLWSLCWMPLVYLIFRSIFRRVGGTRLA